MEEVEERKPYAAPELVEVGAFSRLTEGFVGIEFDFASWADTSAIALI